MRFSLDLLVRFCTGLLLAIVLAACAGPREAAGPTEPVEPLPEPAEEPLDLSAYEDFDAAPYESQPVQRRVEIEHRVPQALMEGRAAAGEEVTMQGYRIQVFSTLEQAEADSLRQSVQRLWRRHYRATADTLAADSVAAGLPDADTLELDQEEPLPPPDVPDPEDEFAEDDEPLRGPFLTTVFDERPGIYLIYKQPYYRIRVGNFARREEAEAALDVIKPHFPNAFVVPDEVTVVR